MAVFNVFLKESTVTASAGMEATGGTAGSILSKTQTSPENPSTATYLEDKTIGDKAEGKLLLAAGEGLKLKEALEAGSHISGVTVYVGCRNISGTAKRFKFGGKITLLTETGEPEISEANLFYSKVLSGTFATDLTLVALEELVLFVETTVAKKYRLYELYLKVETEGAAKLALSAASSTSGGSAALNAPTQLPLGTAASVSAGSAAVKGGNSTPIPLGEAIANSIGAYEGEPTGVIMGCNEPFLEYGEHVRKLLATGIRSIRCEKAVHAIKAAFWGFTDITCIVGNPRGLEEQRPTLQHCLNWGELSAGEKKPYEELFAGNPDPLNYWNSKAEWVAATLKEIEECVAAGILICEIGNEMWYAGPGSAVVKTGAENNRVFYREMCEALIKEVEKAAETNAALKSVVLLVSMLCTKDNTFWTNPLYHETTLRTLTGAGGFAFHPYGAAGGSGETGMQEQWERAVTLGAVKTDVYCTEFDGETGASQVTIAEEKYKRLKGLAMPIKGLWWFNFAGTGTYDLWQEGKWEEQSALLSAIEVFTRVPLITAPSKLELSASSTSAASTAILSAATQFPLSAASSISGGVAALSAATQIALATAASTSTGALSLDAPTLLALASAASLTEGTARVQATAKLGLLAAESASGSSAALSAATQLGLAAAASATGGAASVTAATSIALGAAASSSAGVASLAAATQISLTAAASISGGMLVVFAPVRIALEGAASNSSATGSINAPTALPLAGASSSTGGSASLTAATQLPLGSAASTSTGSAELSAATRLPLTSGASASTGATFVISTPAPMHLTSASSSSRGVCTVRTIPPFPSQPTRIRLVGTSTRCILQGLVTRSAALQGARTTTVIDVPGTVPAKGGKVFLALSEAASGSAAQSAIDAQTRFALAAATSISSSAGALHAATAIGLSSASSISAAGGALDAPTGLSLSAAPSASAGEGVLHAPTGLPLAGALSTSGGSAPLSAPTGLPLGSGASASAGNAALHAPTQMPLAVGASVSAGASFNPGEPPTEETPPVIEE